VFYIHLFALLGPRTYLSFYRGANKSLLSRSFLDVGLPGPYYLVVHFYYVLRIGAGFILMSSLVNELLLIMELTIDLKWLNS
jgi:hypothetical protein